MMSLKNAITGLEADAQYSTEKGDKKNAQRLNDIVAYLKELKAIREEKKAKKGTNEECIRNMTRWELAEFIHNVSSNAIKITTCEEECAKCEYSDSYCTYQIADWLMSGFEEGLKHERTD